MKATRRSFLQTTALAGGAFALQGLITRGMMAAPPVQAAEGTGGYGALQFKPSLNTGASRLALPEGFDYTLIGVVGSPMSDGRPTPGAHDGMAAFAVGNLIHLVRNHELTGGQINNFAFGAQPYDAKATGGTTTLAVDPQTRLIVRDYVSLSGTIRNCAGGLTPWGTWISSEETTLAPVPAPNANSNLLEQVHGYNFEVSASAEGEQTPVALKAMGRFSHEAVAVDPATHFVYETEDANPSGFYRFIPSDAGTPAGRGEFRAANLAAGGTLEMLAVKDARRYDTRTNQTIGRTLDVQWIAINDPDPNLENGALSVVNQGRGRGAAVFARLEGCWYGDGNVYFVSTSGGNIGRGQIWKYTPAEETLTLIVESQSAEVLDSPDNICVSPRGGLVICEDGSGRDYVRGINTQGQVFDFAYPAADTEVAGATFSPDGQTLFFNAQGSGETFAVFPRPGYAWTDGAL